MIKKNHPSFFSDQYLCLYVPKIMFLAEYDELKIPKTERQKNFDTFCRYGFPPKIRQRIIGLGPNYTVNIFFQLEKWERLKKKTSKPIEMLTC